MKKFWFILLEELGLTDPEELDKVKGIDLTRSFIAACIVAVMLVSTINLIGEVHKVEQNRNNTAIINESIAASDVK